MRRAKLPVSSLRHTYPNRETTMDSVKVYGADWCHDTQDTLRHLDRLGVEYSYIDVDEDPQASEWVKRQNGGSESKPTLQIGDEVLSVPSTRELDAALRAHGLPA